MRRHAREQALLEFRTRAAHVEAITKPEPPAPKVKPADGLSKDRPTWQESQEILKKLLAEGKLKTSR